MTMCRASRVDKADGSDSGRVIAALSDAAVIDVTAADQSRVKVGCRTGGNHVKMPWQRAACSGLSCAIPLQVAAAGIHLPVRSGTVCWNQQMRPGPQVPGIRFGGWLARRAAGAGWEIGAPMSDGARRVLVTGASAGIGRACAEELHAADWTVTGASRRGTSSGGWAGLVMDVDDDDSVRTGVAGMLAAGGRIDALVACAGWGLAGAVEQCTIGEAKAQLETNFWGCVRVVQQVLPAMRAQGGGRIVLMSSIGGVIGIPFQAFYSASKFALEGLGEALAYEVAPLGVRVTLVEPGNVKTDFTASRRMAQAADGDPVYGTALAAAVGLMERDEENGVPAADVAAVVRRVLESRRPPRRASVGKAGERAGLLAKRLLPFRAFEAAARSSLGV